MKVGKYTKHKDDMYKIPEKILPTVLGCESQANNSSNETFRYAIKLYFSARYVTDLKEKSMLGTLSQCIVTPSKELYFLVLVNFYLAVAFF